MSNGRLNTNMRKTDQELMWEVFVESSNGGVISTGGPLKGGSSSPKSGNTSEDAEDVDGDSYEDEEDELHGVLKKCHSGDLSPEEAHKHITKMMKGDAEEDAENVKRAPRPSPEEYKRSMGVRGPGGKDLNKKKNTPKLDAMGRPLKDIQGV